MKSLSNTHALLTFALLLMTGCKTASAMQPPTHVASTDVTVSDSHAPLTAVEIATTVQAVKNVTGVPPDGRFPLIALRDPVKPGDEGAGSPPGDARQADVQVYSPSRNQTFEAIVALPRGQIVTWTERRGVQPSLMVSEYERYEAIVKADTRFQAALQRRGITNVSEVFIEGWAAGVPPPGTPAGDRLMRGVCYMKDANYYARPIEGLIPTVDMTTGTLVELMDTGVVPVAPHGGEFAAHPVQSPLPGGRNVHIHGHSVDWKQWRFDFAMHPRDGLVLSNIAFGNGLKKRSILARASVSETVVPYGDPSAAWAWRCAFDEGEYGLGRNSSSVEHDVPAEAVLIDTVFANELGTPIVAKDRIAIYERDGGTVWRHASLDRVQAQRATELLILFVATIGNYDYTFTWIFGEDGTLTADVAASGVMLPKGRDPAAPPHAAHPDGHTVSPTIIAPHHQHFFNFRLDFDIDGTKNSVSEIDTVAQSNAMVMQETQLKTERDAQRDLNLSTSRKWKVYNPTRVNDLGEAPGFIIAPMDNAQPIVGPESIARKRAGFIDHALWVTRYHPNELYAAGDYPNQSEGGDGLTRWVKDDEDLDGQDVVVWYTLGLTHVPRPEEWPVMPAAHTGFKLLPAGFFSQNPLL